MKRETIYWLLFFGVLVVISWLRTTLHDFNEPFLRNPRSNQYEAAQVGDLYVVKDSTGNLQRFFKVIEITKYGRAVRIAEGKLIDENNELDKVWIRKAIERPHYFETKLKQVAKEYLYNFSETTKNYSIYRLSYPPDELPVTLRLFFSPMMIIIFVGIIFGFIWLADQLKLYLSSPYKWILQGGVFLLFATMVGSMLSLIQFQVNFSNQDSPPAILMTYYYFPLIWNCFFMAVMALPFFYCFSYLKRRYLDQYNFADQEFYKFLWLLIGGTSYFLISILIISFLSVLLPNKMSFFNAELIEVDFMLMMTVEGLVTFGIIATANFLNNLRKHIQQLKLKEGLLKQSKQNALSAQSELDILQARVNPHFLYNSLNSIASLAQINPAKTEEMALALSDFYKHSTNRQEEHISSLETELKQLETYLNIEKIRFGERLEYQFDIAEDIKKQSVPRFLLQPLVENAIKYGFNKASNKIELTIKGSMEKGALNLRIIDSGPPFSGDLNTGYGLRGVKKKLKLLYPNAHEIHFMNEPIKQVHIILKSTKTLLNA